MMPSTSVAIAAEHCGLEQRPGLIQLQGAPPPRSQGLASVQWHMKQLSPLGWDRLNRLLWDILSSSVRKTFYAVPAKSPTKAERIGV
jgi:hypothetical protein